MGLTVFDASVLIAFTEPGHVHHADAVSAVRTAMKPGEQRFLSAVTFAELMVGALRADVGDHLRALLRDLRVSIVTVDEGLASRAAAVRTRTRLNLPDAFVLATALELEAKTGATSHVATFDQRLLAARDGR